MSRDCWWLGQRVTGVRRCATAASGCGASCGAGDRDRTGMASLEGLKPSCPQVPNSASDLRLCSVSMTVKTRECPYFSVATDTLGTRDARFRVLVRALRDRQR